ncbi:accessory gene regulator B family protein [bacterium]|nr:accessory gene regulator B family protein [bacterium]
MINSLSQHLAKHLYETSIITESDMELYAYGFFVLISRIIFLIVSVIFGIIFNIVIESILFYILFSFIRSYAGGIHAPTEILCTIFTISSLFMSVLSIKLMLNYGDQRIAFVVYFISLIIIIILSPLDTKEKPLNSNEKKCFKVKTYAVLIVIILISITAMVFHKINIFYSSLMSLVLESILLLSGKIKYVINPNEKY